MIPFNKFPCNGKEEQHLKSILESGKISGDGEYTKKCHQWFSEKMCFNSLLTTSGSSALDMSAILLGIQPGDEVIMPSYTFVSTANAFVLRGAKIKFIDIRPDTMNMDENLIEAAIKDKTRAIVPVHYAGVSCEMDTICSIAKKHNLAVVEDAAQGMMSKYKGQFLGGIGEIGCYSFHETKNYTAGGEGGLLIARDEKLFERAEIIREKGTNRSQFFKGMVDKYTWVDVGSSYLPSELNAAYLYGNLECAKEINNRRLDIWNRYYKELEQLPIDLPTIPKDCEHNAHMFYIKLKDMPSRDIFIKFMKEAGITTPFHYVPLHSSPAGIKFGEFVGEDKYTTSESSRLVRLPIFYNLTDDEQSLVIENVIKFFR